MLQDASPSNPMESHDWVDKFGLEYRYFDVLMELKGKIHRMILSDTEVLFEENLARSTK